MSELAEAFVIALGKILSADPLVLETSLRTLAISATSTLAASALFIPLGCLLHFSRFRGRKAVLSLVQALYSVPTVFIGMLVFLMISRAGPLGGLDLLFTPGGIVIGEVLLIAPIITGLTVSALSGPGPEAWETARVLGASGIRATFTVVSEARFAVATAVLMGFGRAVSEVGVAIVVGGNIAGHTRTLTTAIALGIGKGEAAESIALGIILISLSLLVSFAAAFLGGWRES